MLLFKVAVQSRRSRRFHWGTARLNVFRENKGRGRPSQDLTRIRIENFDFATHTLFRSNLDFEVSNLRLEVNSLTYLCEVEKGRHVIKIRQISDSCSLRRFLCESDCSEFCDAEGSENFTLGAS
jgi:hypothetical protein